jgi:hypothetical protein
MSNVEGKKKTSTLKIPCSIFKIPEIFDHFSQLIGKRTLEKDIYMNLGGNTIDY